jgi:hemerythrin-like domain-containing protein
MGVAYCAEHSNHIHNEEMELFPRAVQWLNFADWEAVADHSRAILDPLFARNELKRFDNLHDYLMAGPPEPEAAS